MSLIKHPDAKMAITVRRLPGVKRGERIVVHFGEKDVHRYSHKMIYLRAAPNVEDRHLIAFYAGLASRLKIPGASIITYVYRRDTDMCYILYLPKDDAIGLVYDKYVPGSAVMLFRTTNKVFYKKYGKEHWYGKAFQSIAGERMVVPVGKDKKDEDGNIDAMIRQFISGFYGSQQNNVIPPTELVGVLGCVKHKRHYHIFAHVRAGELR
jgi:hypothetical protein